MKEESKSGLYILLKEKEGKDLKILTKSNLHYSAFNVRIVGDCISFSDKFHNDVIITISEIIQITQINEGDKNGS